MHSSSHRQPTQHDKHVGPFLKWAGGKSKLLPVYASLLPKSLSGRGYVEPFIGSGAVFFYVKQHLNPASCTLLDHNPELINTWCAIRDHVDEVIDYLALHKARHNANGISDKQRKDYYYQIRAEIPLDASARAARFIYLNKTCYNGLHRMNSKGQFNVPMGNYKQPRICDANHLRSVSDLLQDVTIAVSNFEDCEQWIEDGDFVYCDPPYEPLSRTSHFTRYTKNAFTAVHQQQLRDLLQRISGRAQWLLSNSTAPLIDTLYESASYTKHRVLANRTINRAAEGRGKIEEYAITNYPGNITGPQLVVAHAQRASKKKKPMLATS